MKQRRPLRTTLLAAAVGAAVVLTAADAIAQSASPRERAEQRRAEREQRQGSKSKQATEYPNATRKSPEAKASARMGSRLQKLSDLHEKEKYAEVRAAAEEIMASESANAYDKAIAAQLAANAAYEMDDTAEAIANFQKAIEFNGLDNDGHYNSMLMLAQLQLQEDKLAEGVATLDRFLSETKSEKPDHLVLKGNALYQLERYPEAAAVLKQAIEASPEPRNDWLQLLMATYAEAGQMDEAARLAEQVAQRTPNDKRAQLNLAAIYQQSDRDDKAVEVLERLRAAGQLTEDKDYRLLYGLYANMDGKEKETIAVVNEGLQKGILKPDYQAYLALGQSYYYSDQIPQAIDAYRKAAPLAPDGETYLNLAKMLWQEDRIAEAKEAARQAIAKGLQKPGDAKKILALPGGK